MNFNEIWHQISAVCIELALKIVASLVVLIVGRFLIRFAIKHFPVGSKNHPLDPTARSFLLSISKVTMYIFLAVTIVGILGVPLASTVTVIGAVGAAVALAIQGSLGNMVSGIMILIFKPMKIDDYIETSDASGTVKELGIFYTTLVTPDNRFVTIPNANLTTTTITNYSRADIRRAEVAFSISRSADLELTKTLISDIVSSHADILESPAPFIRMTAVDSSAVTVTVRVWCPSNKFWDVKFDLTESIKNALDKNGIEIPFQQIDVHMK